MRAISMAGSKGSNNLFFFFSWKQSSTYLFVEEEGELALMHHLYVHRQCRSVPPSGRYCTVLDGRGGRSVLEAQRRRVGLDEDGPEYLHVLARARLHVLVQDVDPQLCFISSPRNSMSTQFK